MAAVTVIAGILLNVLRRILRPISLTAATAAGAAMLTIILEEALGPPAAAG